MAKYTQEIARLFSLQNLQEIQSVAKKLTIDQIKILQIETLPIIENIERRNDLKAILNQREQELYTEHGKERVIAESLTHAESLGDQLKNIFDIQTSELITALKNEEIRKLFLQKASQDELYVLKRKLGLMASNQALELFKVSIDDEIEKRKKNPTVDPQIWMEKFREFKKNEGNLQWETNIWTSLYAGIEQASQQVVKSVEAEKPPQKQEEPEVKKSWWSRVWSSITTSILNVFSRTPPQPVYKTPNLSSKDKLDIDDLRKDGAQRIANVTGIVKVGEAEELSEASRMHSMMSRFGMVLASQVVAGSKSDKHRILHTVAESLANENDPDKTLVQLQTALDGVLPKEKDNNPLRGNHALATGGNPEFVTAFESEVFQSLLDSPERFREQGLTLTDKEREQIAKYHENMDRSRDLSNALTSVCYDWGGYERDGSGYKRRADYQVRNEKFDKKVDLASKSIQEACAQLKDGESLYLETGVENHAMQLVIKKEGNEFKLSTYDSSGAMENTSLSRGPLSLLKLSQLRQTEAKRKNALTFNVPQDKLISEEGLKYISGLVRSNSMVGWAETKIEHHLKTKSRAERAQMWFPVRLYYDIQARKKFQIYMDKFTSLASKDSPAKFEETLQHSQNTSNCFAKKAQSCEFYELGKGTYKKVRLAMVLEQKDKLLKDIRAGGERFVSAEYTQMLKDIESQYLSPAELHELSMRLCEVKEPPSADYYNRFFNALLDATKELDKENKPENKLASQRIEEKISKHAQAYYNYLKKANRQGDIETVFSPEVANGIFKWDSKKNPLKTTSDGQIDKAALNKLSEFASAQAWKASLQLLNHQIRRLSVNERHIKSESERLPHASLREVREKVTLEDLENANVVNYTTGFTRQEEIKIEINVNGKRKEIDKATFFTLIVNNNEALTNPKVMGILDYLRNASPDIERRYTKEVYPTQRKAFEKKLEDASVKTAQSVTLAIGKLTDYAEKLKWMRDLCAEKIPLLEEAINSELSKNSIKCKNLDARLSLLKKEYAEIDELFVGVSKKIKDFQQTSEGTLVDKIIKTKDLLSSLRSAEGPKTINEVSTTFLKGIKKLEEVEQEIVKTFKNFEGVEIENQIRDRLQNINQFRQRVIGNHLQGNAEYRILEELVSGRMGTELDRNRQMYQQSPFERAQHIRSGKNTFLQGSVFQEIQSLNQKLRTRVSEIIEREIILGSQTPETHSLAALESADSTYVKMEQQIQELSKRPLPPQVKAEWVNEMFAIWLKHESPLTLHTISEKYGLDPTEGVNQAFHHFLEQKANIKYGALKDAGFEIDLSLSQIEAMRWKPVKLEEHNDHLAKLKKAVNFIGEKRAENLKVKTPVTAAIASGPTPLATSDLVAQHDTSLSSGTFTPPEITFLSPKEMEVVDGSTLDFLRDNPAPTPDGMSQEECEKYFNEVNIHLQKLNAHNRLENKAQRLSEFCNSSATTLFTLPFPPRADLITELSKNLLNNYRNEESTLNDGFLKLENIERSQLLSSLIKLQLLQIPETGDKTKVNSKFYSTIKQWEKLIDPRDEALSKKISKLSPGGTEPNDITLMKEVDTALHHSPIGLEGLYEGQKGLQVAITVFGKGKPEGVDTNLRQLADRLGMRNGDALLASQLIKFYSDPKLLYSSEGINSTQGRELFARAFLDAFRNASASDKRELWSFVNDIDLESSEIACSCITPHETFMEEVLLRCASQDPKSFNEALDNPGYVSDPPFTSVFIDSSTKSSITDGSVRLFGFAKEVNLLSLQIEYALKSDPVDQENLDKLYSKLICSNLAYQLQLDQSSEEELENLSENFEYVREMSLAQVNMNKFKPQLIDFSNKIDSSPSFFSTLSKYLENKKFDGPPILAKSASHSDIPGFISLGGNRTLDVVHGAVYVGSNRLGMMPAHLQSHIAVQELGLMQLPFRPNAAGYAYSEGKDIKAFILPREDGSITIQRELMTFDGTPQMLQYISPEKMDSVPQALKRGLNAEHFFIDANNTIYGYTADFKPILKIEKNAGLWSGVILDHQGNKTEVQLDNSVNLAMVKDLARLFPPSEMISVNADTVYIPSISKYITSAPVKGSGNYFISDNLTDNSSRRHLTVTEQGSALTTKELTESETNEIVSLKEKIQIERNKAVPLAQKGDILSKQEKAKIDKQIKESEDRIRELTSPEQFIFIADSEKVKTLEKDHLGLRIKMQEAFLAFRSGAKKDRKKLSEQYETAKSNYIQSKKDLQKAYAESNHLRTFEVQGSKLQVKDFASILHVAAIPGKAELLTQLISTNILKSPLKPSEFEELKALKEQYKNKPSLSKEELVAHIMLMGVELQHYLLQRTEAASGKLRDWDRAAYNKLKEEFAAEVKAVNELPGKLPLTYFGEVWRAIQSEFIDDTKLTDVFKKPTLPSVGVVVTPLSMNTKTTNMPIETMGGRSLVEFALHESLDDRIDPTQLSLERLLQGLEGFEESVKAQEDGYYYENYGVFNKETLEKLFSVSSRPSGLAGLTKAQVGTLFELMETKGWIHKIEGTDNKYRLTSHPSEFFSATTISSFLTEAGFDRGQIRDISDRLEIFLYQTAVNGGDYKLKEGARDDLLSMLAQSKDKCNVEYLQASSGIEDILKKASSPISMGDLNAAYLLNDFSSILAHFPEDQQRQVQIALNNGMTRYLYYKTELDHLNDIQAKFDAKQDASAISMLHTRRNYQLDELFESDAVTEGLPSEKVLQIEQDRKMQRAFLLFESEFGHRCNARQVNVFRGLLIDDELNPDKIDSAQARMGFGKTSLLPLVALYKTGDKLVRFVVPKSAIETNTSDMSTTLTNILGRRAVKDEFHRYRIATDPEKNMEDSPRLKSLQDAKADLQKRLALYQRVKENREVLVQSPSVRNSLECQAKIFLDMMMNDAEEPRHQKELMECISLLNKIRSLSTISVFDELDATQDPATTEVNYTTGKKISLNTDEIYPLELITQAISQSENKSPEHLGALLLQKFGIQDDSEKNILKFITSLQAKEPPGLGVKEGTPIYLMRAILSNPVMLSVFTEKEAGTDFGVWFENAKDGSKAFDYEALKTAKDESRTPLLIAIPYSAANTPKPRGSRFDNPEVTAITTFLYYLDPRTEIMEVPHLEFLVDSFRKGVGEEAFLDPTGTRLDPEFQKIFKEISKIAEIQDPLIRSEARKKYFSGLDERIKSGELPPNAFRKMLARTIIQEQIKFDAGKANSNRYEQGSADDVVIGFSGTAGDTSSHFQENMLDPAADGNMTLGIMGRANCQDTTGLDTTSFVSKGEDYTTSIVRQLTGSFTANTRTLIDVGGLCKASNKAVAKEIALQLKNSSEPNLKALKGVIFYDDVTNMKKLLTLDENNNEKIVDLTPKMVAESDKSGSYFTYYDQSHSRGADIKQMDKAHAVLTLNFTVTNNDHKQAIMRMRKIVDKSLGQSFSTAVPDNVKEKIITDLGLPKEHKLTGNDIALWLRQKELKNNLSNVTIISTELDSVIKNAILQQQAQLTELMSKSDLTPEQIHVFRQCIKELNDVSSFISGGSSELREKYGKVFGKVKKEEFVRDLHASFDKRLAKIFVAVNEARKSMGLPPTTLSDKAPYETMEQRIINRRKVQLSDEFILPSSSSALSEAHSESESQSQSQSESQTQTHSFSEVATEEVVVEHVLSKEDIPVEPISISYLSQIEEINKLALASKIPTLTHLFKDDDPIRCSPMYNADARLATNLEQPTPPVRYFLARDDGNPKVILINQDEANLFKSSPTAPWTLYDVRITKDNKLDPISGPPIEFLQEPVIESSQEPVDSLRNPILKKLLFAASRFKVDPKNIPSSLEGICTPQQLIPTLSMKYEASPNVSAKDGVFRLQEWGFSGDKQKNIQVKVEQTHETFKEKHVKKGVTISIGEGDQRAKVFILDKLNKRILAEVEKQKHGDVPPTQSKLKKIRDDINREYSTTLEARSKLKDELREIQSERKKVIGDSNTDLALLESQKAEAIKLAKAEIGKSHNDALKNLLNLRKGIQNNLTKNLLLVCQLKTGDSKEFGIDVFGKHFPDLDKAVQYGVQQLYEENKKNPMSEEELASKLEACVQTVYRVVEDRYQNVTNYQNKSKTVMERLHAASLDLTPNSLTKTQIESAFRTEMYDVRQQWTDSKATPPDKKWGALIDMIDDIVNKSGKNLSAEAFQEKIEEGIKQFATANKMAPEVTKNLILPRIVYSLTPGEKPSNIGLFDVDPNKRRNLAVIKSEITNVIRRNFVSQTKTASGEQVEFYTKINGLLSKQLTAYDRLYNLPERLLDFKKSPISRDEIKEAIQEAFTRLNVRVTPKQLETFTDESVSYLLGRKAVEDILDRFKSVESRSAQLPPVDGKEAKMFGPMLELLTKLDGEVGAIQKKIDEARAQRHEHMVRLDILEKEKRQQLKEKEGVFDVLREEKSAINKLLSGIKALFSMFKEKQVNVPKEEPLEFLDRNFDLGEIIESDVSLTATLSFNPPEFYDVDKDMQAHVRHMHGVENGTESICRGSLVKAHEQVLESASAIQERECRVELDLQKQMKEQLALGRERIVSNPPTTDIQIEVVDELSVSAPRVLEETLEQHVELVSDVSKQVSMVDISKSFKERLSSAKGDVSPSIEGPRMEDLEERGKSGYVCK